MQDTTRRIPRRALLAAAIAGLVVALAAGTAGAQEWAGRGRVQGRITDAAGAPIAGARVTLHQDTPSGPGPEPIVAGDEGRWSYLGLANGTWVVVVEADGFIPSEGSIKVSEFGSNPPVNVALNPITAEMKAAATGNEALTKIEEGNTHLAAGRPAEARAAYEAALALLESENHPPVLRGIARAYYEEGKADAAISTLEKALAQAPDDEETLRLVINLLVASDREDEAAAYMARLPEGAEVEPETLLNVGIKAYNEGDMAAALASFDKVVAQNPELADAYYYRGLAYLNGERNAEALADFQKLLELDPQHGKVEEVQQFIEYLQSQSQEG